MSSVTTIPIGEYLETIYHPDREYVDGELLERNVGEWEHSALQAIIVSIFQANRRHWEVFGLPELRNQVSTSNYRVPDICIVRTSDPRERIVSKAPLICIEILSSGDTFRELRKKIDNYIGMGVSTYGRSTRGVAKVMSVPHRHSSSQKAASLSFRELRSGWFSRRSLPNLMKCSSPALLLPLWRNR